MAAVVEPKEEESVARRFWNRSQKEIDRAVYSPFVVCLAAGNLEMECFREYISQDIHFLNAYVHAYEIAEECADDDDAKDGISKMRKSVLKELKMHNSIVGEWGVDPTKEIVPIPSTTKYIDFLLATAAGKIEGGKGPDKIVTPFEKTKIAAYTVGVMTPWMRLYSFLGELLGPHLSSDESDNVYRKWFENYASENFEAAMRQMEELLDKLSVSLTGEELEVIDKLYSRAMKLEIEVFSSQRIIQPVIVPLIKMRDTKNQFLIFSNFDLTCTTVDSSAMLAEVAILTVPRADHSGPDDLVTRRSSLNLRSSWEDLSAKYTEEYETIMGNIRMLDKVETLDFESLYEKLELFSDFEKQANSRVVESGLLGGMNLGDIKRAGEHLILQDGCRDFFQKVVSNKEKLNSDLYMISYCWCADLIRSAFPSDIVNAMSIHSNEIEYEKSVSTGNIIRKIESPLEKVEVLKTILSKSSSNGSHLSVYIGHAVGDLLCLLEADVGIVIGSNTSLREVAEQFGVSFHPLFAGVISKQRQLVGEDTSIWKYPSSTLYTVSSWAEIQAFVLGE
ncbi:putative aminopyrimidine aminohydrolase [Dioscorea sansibarensis]